ncbi:DUF6104 family protein [Streptomyces peucetius]
MNNRAVYFTDRGTEEPWKRHGEEEVTLERDAALAPVSSPPKGHPPGSSKLSMGGMG